MIEKQKHKYRERPIEREGERESTKKDFTNYSFPRIQKENQKHDDYRGVSRTAEEKIDLI